MRRNFLFIAVLFLSFGALAQQSFRFNYAEGQLDDSEILDSDLRPHYLGQEFSLKMAMLWKSYTWLEEASAVNPAPKRVTDKTPIFTAMKKLNSYYKKQLKAGTITEALAKEKLQRVMDIVLCIRYQNTIEFEEFLLQKANKKPAALDELFSQRVTLSGSSKYNTALSSAGN